MIRAPCTSRVLKVHMTMVLVLLLNLDVSQGVLVNATVDDQLGDSVTGVQPIYSGPPTDGWKQGATCMGCKAQLNGSLALDGTWHDATWHPGDSAERLVEIDFVGSAVYVFVILANTIPLTTTLTSLSFSIDGDVVGDFVHIPSTSLDFEYNVPAYVNTSLINTKHTLRMQTTGDNASLVLFDYLIYSSDNETVVTAMPSATPSSFGLYPGTSLPVISISSIPTNPTTNPIPISSIPTSPTPSTQTETLSRGHNSTDIIVGTVLGGLVLIALFTGLFIYKRWKAYTSGLYKHADRLPTASVYPTEPTYSNGDSIEQITEISEVHGHDGRVLVMADAQRNATELQQELARQVEPIQHEVGALKFRTGEIQESGVFSNDDVQGRRRNLDLTEGEGLDENNALRDQVLFLLDELERMQAEQGVLGANDETLPDYSTEGRRSPGSQMPGQ